MFPAPSRIYKFYKLTFKSVQAEEQEEVLGYFAFSLHKSNFKSKL